MKGTLVYFPYGTHESDSSEFYLKLESKRGLYRGCQDEKDCFYEVWIPWNSETDKRVDEWDEVSHSKHLLYKLADTKLFKFIGWVCLEVFYLSYCFSEWIKERFKS